MESNGGDNNIKMESGRHVDASFQAHRLLVASATCEYCLPFEHRSPEEPDLTVTVDDTSCYLTKFADKFSQEISNQKIDIKFIPAIELEDEDDVRYADCEGLKEPEIMPSYCESTTPQNSKTGNFSLSNHVDIDPSEKGKSNVIQDSTTNPVDAKETNSTPPFACLITQDPNAITPCSSMIADKELATPSSSPQKFSSPRNFATIITPSDSNPLGPKDMISETRRRILESRRCGDEDSQSAAVGLRSAVSEEERTPAKAIKIDPTLTLQNQNSVLLRDNARLRQQAIEDKFRIEELLMKIQSLEKSRELQIDNFSEIFGSKDETDNKREEILLTICQDNKNGSIDVTTVKNIDEESPDRFPSDSCSTMTATTEATTPSSSPQRVSPACNVSPLKTVSDPNMPGTKEMIREARRRILESRRQDDEDTRCAAVGLPTEDSQVEQSPAVARGSEVDPSLSSNETETCVPLPLKYDTHQTYQLPITIKIASASPVELTFLEHGTYALEQKALEESETATVLVDNTSCYLTKHADKFSRELSDQDIDITFIPVPKPKKKRAVNRVSKKKVVRKPIVDNGFASYLTWAASSSFLSDEFWIH